jgi:hypothetical protein
MIEGICVMPSVGGLGPALFVLYENGCLQVYSPVPSSSPDASVVAFDKRGSDYHAGTAAREILQRRAIGTGVSDQQGHTNGMASLAAVDASHELQQWHTQGPSRAEKMTEVTKWTSLSILGDGVRESSRSEPILGPGNVGTTIAIRLEVSPNLNPRYQSAMTPSSILSMPFTVNAPPIFTACFSAALIYYRAASWRSPWCGCVWAPPR